MKINGSDFHTKCKKKKRLNRMKRSELIMVGTWKEKKMLCIGVMLLEGENQ